MKLQKKKKNTAAQKEMISKFNSARTPLASPSPARTFSDFTVKRNGRKVHVPATETKNAGRIKRTLRKTSRRRQEKNQNHFKTVAQSIVFFCGFASPFGFALGFGMVFPFFFFFHLLSPKMLGSRELHKRDASELTREADRNIVQFQQHEKEKRKTKKNKSYYTRARKKNKREKQSVTKDRRNYTGGEEK